MEKRQKEHNPMKKYNSYKDSGIEWIGEIPSHWEVKKVKHSIQLIMGQSPNSDDCNSKRIGIPFLQGNADFSLIYPLPQSWCEKPTKIAPANSVLLSVRAPIGAVNIADTDYCIGRGLCALVSENSKFWYYTSICLYDELNSMGTGSTFKAISTQQILNTFTSLPTPEEQTIIANYLDRKTAEIDELIADKKRLLELYEEEKTALINQAVTKGLNHDVPMKDSGIEWLGEIPEHWEVKRFDFLFSFSRGLPITKADLQDTGIPCVSYGEIHSKYGFEVDPKKHDLRCVKESYLDSHKKSLLEFGDFVFADTSEDIEGSGNFTYLNSEDKAFAGYHTIIAKPKKRIIYRYIAYYFNTLQFRNQIRSKVTGTKVYSITQAILKFTNVIFPPIDEQQSTAEYLDKECFRIDAKKAKTEKLIELLTEYRTALISEVVTGKIKVV